MKISLIMKTLRSPTAENVRFIFGIKEDPDDSIFGPKTDGILSGKKDIDRRNLLKMMGIGAVVATGIESVRKFIVPPNTAEAAIEKRKRRPSQKSEAPSPDDIEYGDGVEAFMEENNIKSFKSKEIGFQVKLIFRLGRSPKNRHHFRAPCKIEKGQFRDEGILIVTSPEGTKRYDIYGFDIDIVQVGSP